MHFWNLKHSGSTKMHRHECNTHNFYLLKKIKQGFFSYTIFPVKKNKCWKNFKIVRKSLFNYSHPEIGNFRVWHQPSKPCSPEVPTQRDISAIVGITQLLEGQNSVLIQIVYDIIQGRYGKPYQNNLADNLSQSLSVSMVEQARLFNLLEEYVSQDQPQASDSILPPSRLPMDLRVEEDAIRGNRRVLSEIDVSEWEITCTDTCPREGKRSCNPSSATQLPTSETPSRTTKRAKKKERKRLRLIQEAQQPISKPKDLPPRLCYNCRQPGHFVSKCPKPR
jgi:hypothetical protein